MLLVKSMIKRGYKNIILDVLDLISKIYFERTSELKKEYAFIRLDLLGDNFIFFPFLLKYSKIYPNALWIVNSKVAPLYFVLGVDYFSINLRNFSLNPLYRIKVLKKLLAFSFKKAVNLVPHRSQGEGDKILSLLKSTKKICYGNDFISRKNFNNTICNEIITYDYKSLNGKYIHIFHHEKNFFEKLTQFKLNENIKDLYISSFKFLKEKLARNYVYKYILLITTASVKYRLYPLNSFQKILDKLPKNIKIIQIGLNKFPLTHPNLIDLTGKTSLEEAMSLVMNASLVIGNETGLTHLAYLSGVPTVCILGGGHFGRFLPWPEFNDIVKSVYIPMGCFQCGWKCKYVNLQKGEVPPCIAEIPPKQVIEAIDELNERFKIL